MTRAPIVLSILILLSMSLGVMSAFSPARVLAQSNTIRIVLTMKPSPPIANQNILFFYNAAAWPGDVVAIAIIQGPKCTSFTSALTNLVAGLNVNPPLEVGSELLRGGLPAGVYTAILLVMAVNTNQTPAIINPCFTFTVVSSASTPEFPSSLALLPLVLLMTAWMFKKRKTKNLL